MRPSKIFLRKIQVGKKNKMNKCEKIREEQEDIKTLFKEFGLELEKAETGAETPEEAKVALEKTKELRGNGVNSIFSRKEKK